ncbi:hypothetical protein [Nonomuraea sp. NPDC050643]|uniref:hypothetical protein n=1 Tax=Nonomuraea sp. NPDC050643 TaxID=3155660 RepID=UPI0033E4D2ED
MILGWLFLFVILGIPFLLAAGSVVFAACRAGLAAVVAGLLPSDTTFRRRGRLPE